MIRLAFGQRREYRVDAVVTSCRHAMRKAAIATRRGSENDSLIADYGCPNRAATSFAQCVNGLNLVEEKGLASCTICHQRKEPELYYYHCIYKE